MTTKTGRTAQLSPAQDKALALIREHGVLYAGNEYDVSFSTVRALKVRGLVDLTVKMLHRSHTPKLGLPTSYWVRDWVAKPSANQ